MPFIVVTDSSGVWCGSVATVSPRFLGRAFINRVPLMCYRRLGVEGYVYRQVERYGVKHRSNATPHFC